MRIFVGKIHSIKNILEQNEFNCNLSFDAKRRVILGSGKELGFQFSNSRNKNTNENEELASLWNMKMAEAIKLATPQRPNPKDHHSPSKAQPKSPTHVLLNIRNGSEAYHISSVSSRRMLWGSSLPKKKKKRNLRWKIFYLLNRRCWFTDTKKIILS